MSLQIAAQHLASRGRGPDTALVHMAPSEVAGLQALAKAHGGSLTVNPDTGLPEAGFLKSILPLALGAVLGPAGLGMSAGMAGLTVGAVGTLATGSLQKGLMAGLGAYGGAGLAGGLAGAGADAAMAQGMTGASMGPQTAAQLGSGFESTMAAQGLTPVAQAVPAAQAGMQTVAGVPNLQVTNALPPAPTGPAALPQTLTKAPDMLASQVANNEAMAKAALDAKTAYGQSGILDKLSGGLKALGQEGGATSALNAMGGGANAMQYGLAALTPMMSETPKSAKYDGGPNPYQFAFDWERPSGPSYDSREALQLRGNLRPITTMAAGGPVEDMSNRNFMETMLANGGQMYAEGGSTDEKPDVAKGMTGASADALRYLMGRASTSPATQAAQSYVAGRQPTPVFSIGPGTTTSPVTPAPAAAISETGEIPTPIMNFNPATGQLTVLPPPPVESVTVPFSPSLEMAANGGLMGLAAGGQSHLGDYSDGGRLLRGPGNGTSDSIPATIADKRPARLADGEFVIPSRIVSELGNGSTEAGARQLYAMMDRIQKARAKTVGKNKVAVDAKARNELPA